MLYLLGLVLVLGAVAVVAVVHAHRKALAQQRASDARLAAMFRATTRTLKPPASNPAAGAPAEAAPPAVGLREERDCPFCAEPILKKARVCKHCGRDVEPLA